MSIIIYYRFDGDAIKGSTHQIVYNEDEELGNVLNFKGKVISGYLNSNLNVNNLVCFNNDGTVDFKNEDLLDDCLANNAGLLSAPFLIKLDFGKTPHPVLLGELFLRFLLASLLTKRSFEDESFQKNSRQRRENEEASIERAREEDDPLKSAYGSSIYNGIIRGEEFPRDNLMNKLVQYIKKGESLIIMSSPRATGKSSFLQLVRSEKPIKGAIYSYVPMIGAVNSSDENRPFEFLQQITGIRFTGTGWEIPKEWVDQKVILIIDDAQAVYYSSRFWSFFLKAFDNLPKNITSVISCTHLLSGGGVEFRSCSARISGSDFLMSKEEAHRLIVDGRIGLRAPLRDYKTLCDIIVNDCNGHIGALRITIDHLNKKTWNTPITNERNAISSYLDIDLSSVYSRCWEFPMDPTWNAVGDNYVILLLGDVLVDAELEKDPRLKLLIRNGILKINDRSCSIEFSSVLAKRFFCRQSYTNRASAHQFTNLQDLALRSVKVMSSNALARSMIDNHSDFPKEATFQHLFMESLTRLTKPMVRVLSDLAKSFPSVSSEPSEGIPREIDFYVKNGDIAWGIELLISGRNVEIKESIDQFAEDGKYAGLHYNDYIVIDFRFGKPTHHQVIKHEKRITVYFNSKNFETCTCVVGNSTEFVTLALNK